MKKKIAPVLAAAMIAGAMVATDASAQWRGPGWGWRGPGYGWRGPGWGWRGPGWRPGVAAGVIGGAVIAGAIIASRPPGYVVYPGYAEPLYAPDCYWASQPVLDPAGRVVGYTGRPVQVCPGYAGPPPRGYAGPPPPPYDDEPPPPAYAERTPPGHGGPPPAARMGPPPSARAPAAARSVSRDGGQPAEQGVRKPAPQGASSAPRGPSGPPSAGLPSDRPQPAQASGSRPPSSAPPQGLE